MLYFAEIFRGGIVAIPTGQYEAFQVLNWSSWQTIRYIILPCGGEDCSSERLQ